MERVYGKVRSESLNMMQGQNCWVMPSFITSGFLPPAPFYRRVFLFSTYMLLLHEGQTAETC